MSVALPILGVTAFWQNVFNGAVIVAALLIERWVRESGTRAMTAERDAA